MKKLIRIITIILILTICATGFSFAGTEGTASKSVLPGTNVKADSRVVDAFTALEFDLRYDSTVDYAGCFSVAQHAIILKKSNTMATLHEVGHFVACLKDKADMTKEFKKIYTSEKKKYDGANKAYITKNSKEYFAQSFAEYTKSPKALKESRPKTYAYIENTVNSITDADVTAMYNAYGWAW